MNKLKYYGLMLFLCWGFTACDDILEPDITREEVQLVLPADSSNVKRAEVGFRWEEVSGSSSYRLQIASPSLGRPSQFYMDTVSARTSLSLALQPGRYEWQVQAINGGYRTAFTSGFFMVDSVSNLTGAEVRLISPSNQMYTNRIKTRFEWEAVEFAEKYILEVLLPNRYDTVVYTTVVDRTMPRAEATYEWRVRALSATGAVVSTTRLFTTDFEVPGSPDLLYPRSDTTIMTWPVALKWQRKAADVVNDSLFLYLGDESTVMRNFPQRVSSSAFTLTSGMSLVPGTYYWAVKSYDRAGNTSVLSGKRRFTVRLKTGN